VWLMSFVCEATGPSARIVLRQAMTHATPGVPSAAIAADGRLVAVVSMARLLPADTNSLSDIYVLDRTSGTLTLETVSPNGTVSNGTSDNPRLSAGGRYLVFHSVGTNLTGLPDRNDVQDVFLRDRQAGITRRLSLGLAGQEANANSAVPAIDDEGAFVAFVSSATNLAPEDDANGAGDDVYLVRVATGVISRVSLDNQGRQFDFAHSPSLDANGRLVAFTARERATPPAQRGGSKTLRDVAVYVRDVTSGVTTCISCARDDARDGLPAFAPDLSADGRSVAFAVQSEPQRSDVAIHDRSSSVTTVITRKANARSAGPRVSADGRAVVFESWASDLLCERRCSVEELDENVLPDIYLFDVATKRFSRLSGSDRVWWAPSVAPAIDAHGRTVVFSSRQAFGPEDVTVDFDLYVCAPACE
ncbi:MAG: TolB family protein, partial [Burkholderiales bacterium]